MTGIVLSASVRQNLLSLQSTATLRDHFLQQLLSADRPRPFRRRHPGGNRRLAIAERRDAADRRDWRRHGKPSPSAPVPARSSTLNQLNAALAANNLTRPSTSTGTLTFTTSNDPASATIGAFTRHRIATGKACDGLVAVHLLPTPTRRQPVPGWCRSTTTSFSRSPPLRRMRRSTASTCSAAITLKLVFNETGKSTLSITGVNFNAGGLGLGNLTSGTDFIDNASTNKVLTTLNTASRRCVRRRRPWVRTCRSCRSVRTSRRT